MEAIMRILLIMICLLMPSLSLSSPHPLTCYPPPNLFLHRLHRQCPPQIPPSPLPIQVDGETLEKVLRSTPKDAYTAVLFYESGSPLSSSMRFNFDLLSSMFPQVGHIAVERALAMPSLFSRYGIHSLPALFIVNHDAEIRYYGLKELHSLARFYKKSTGLDPIEHHAYCNAIDVTSGQEMDQPWYRSSWREMIVKEPYLVFAFLFLVLRGFIYVCPEVWCRVTALWMLCKRQFNLGIFGESNQLLGRVAHLMDVKRVWSKLKLCKTRNFLKGARSARVWASSLASVSLGESSSARPSPSIES